MLPCSSFVLWPFSHYQTDPFTDAKIAESKATSVGYCELLGAAVMAKVFLSFLREKSSLLEDNTHTYKAVLVYKACILYLFSLML